MRIITILIIMLLIISCDTTKPQNAELAQLIIVNGLESIDNTISSVFVKQTSSEEWGSSRISVPLSPNDNRTITLEKSLISISNFDIKAITSTDRELYKYNIQLKNGEEIMFTDQIIRIKNLIENNQLHYINEVRIKKTSSEIWGMNLFTGLITYDSTVNVGMIDPLIPNTSYDIRVLTINQKTYEIRESSVSDGQTVTFTASNQISSPQEDKIYIRNEISDNPNFNINQLFIRKIGAEWSGDLITAPIPYSTSGDGREITFSTPLSNEKYDVRAVAVNSNVYLKAGIILNNESRIVFTNADDINPYFTIKNGTERIAKELYIKEQNVTDWGKNLISGNLNINSDRVIYTGTGIRDLLLISDTNIFYTKQKTNIAFGGLITFQETDGHFVILENKTGNIVTGFHTKPTNSNQWSNSLINSNLGVNATIIFHQTQLPTNEIWNLTLDLRFSNATTTFTKQNILIHGNEKISFNPEDNDNPPPPENDKIFVRNQILNNPDFAINQIQLKLTSSQIWSENLIDDIITYSTSGNGQQITLSTPLSGADYDLKATTINGNTYQKTKIKLSNGSAVVFVMGDVFESSKNIRADQRSALINPQLLRVSCGKPQFISA